MEQKTHWKKLNNYDYLGAYSLEPGQDMILTINVVKNEIVKGPDGKKEQCMVMTFMEKQKPMIVNATNAKMIQKLYKTPYIEEWIGRKIQLYVEMVKAFGDTVEALRIRPYIPKQATIDIKCSNCEKEVQPFGKNSAEQMAQYAYQKFGKVLCTECATKINDAGKVADPL